MLYNIVGILQSQKILEGGKFGDSERLHASKVAFISPHQLVFTAACPPALGSLFLGTSFLPSR
jgi:hypothetical protein